MCEGTDVNYQLNVALQSENLECLTTTIGNPHLLCFSSHYSYCGPVLIGQFGFSHLVWLKTRFTRHLHNHCKHCIKLGTTYYKFQILMLRVVKYCRRLELKCDNSLCFVIGFKLNNPKGYISGFSIIKLLFLQGICIFGLVHLCCITETCFTNTVNRSKASESFKKSWMYNS